MLSTLFSGLKPVIGMIHVGALPGTPANRQSISELAKAATNEAKLYLAEGVDGLIIENMHDLPYLRGEVGPEIVASMAVIGHSVRSGCALPTGIQILAAANIEAMAVAHAAGLDFIRAEGYVFGHIADEGWIESSAARLLRYRKMIGAEEVDVWADIKKKHSSHSVTADISLAETAEAVEFMRGDAVIVTGSTTGRAPQPGDVREVRTRCNLPVILGSGVDASNVREFFHLADGFIIGSYFKEEGVWSRPVDSRRIAELMAIVNELRETDGNASPQPPK
jgi:membrane complex biogenesis BtpA family protein